MAVLVLNDQQAAADRIAADAPKQLSTPDFEHTLGEAREGVVPAPWP